MNLSIETIAKAIGIAEHNIQSVLTSHTPQKIIELLIKCSTKSVNIQLVLTPSFKEQYAENTIYKQLLDSSIQCYDLWKVQQGIPNSFWMTDAENLLVYPGLANSAEYHEFFRDKESLLAKYKSQFQDLIFESICLSKKQTSVPKTPKINKPKLVPITSKIKIEEPIQLPFNTQENQLELQASSTEVLRGEAIQLHWKAEDFDRVEWLPSLNIDATQNPILVFPSTSTNYRLIAYKGNQSVSKEVFITVKDQPTLEYEILLLNEQGAIISVIQEQFVGSQHFWVEKGQKVAFRWKSYAINELYINDEKVGQSGTKEWTASELVCLKVEGIGTEKRIHELITVNAIPTTVTLHKGNRMTTKIAPLQKTNSKHTPIRYQKVQ